jgi:hypothetical protein
VPVFGDDDLTAAKQEHPLEGSPEIRRALKRTRAGPIIHVGFGAQLCLTNAILSSVFGLEFPIGEAQWPRILETHDALKDMLREQQAGSDLPDLPA